jgi:hypothetical protein
MFKTTAATSPDDYIEALEEPRRTQIRELDRLIGEVAPQLERHMQSGILAYGHYHDRYASGREGEWFRIGLASNKLYISLYVTESDGERYLAETYKDRLPKADIGRSCVRFAKLEDLDRSTLESLIREGAAATEP